MEPSVSYTELVPMRKEPFLPVLEKPIRRAPSYSDSFLVLHSSHSPSKQSAASSGIFEYLDLAPVSSSSQLAVIDTNSEVISESKHNWIPSIAEKGTSAVFHIFLISIFESVFFRLFITKSEDKGILTTVQRLVGGVTDTCKTWNHNQTVILNDILTLFVNTTHVEYQSSLAYVARANYNSTIFARSWIYVGALGSLTLVFVFVSIWRKWIQRTHIRQILLENMGLVAMLGLYEYMFFSTVIYNYDSISVSEIEGNLVQILQGQCGLFQ